MVVQRQECLEINFTKLKTNNFLTGPHFPANHSYFAPQELRAHVRVALGSNLDGHPATDAIVLRQ